jgi:bacillaene synthase trans-acting acyltransferase
VIDHVHHRRPVVFLFAGQGAQYYGMGRELLRVCSVFREHMEAGDALYRNVAGRSLLDAIYAPGCSNADSFDDLLVTHPANFVIAHALARSLASREIVPDITLGYSLGEFAAAVAAGVLSFEDAFASVFRQAELVTDLCQEGAMTAVLGPSGWLNEHPDMFAGTELACSNLARHFVLAGPTDAIARTEGALAARDVCFQRLPLRFAFHSRAMECMASVRSLLQPRGLRAAALPFFSCSARGRVESFDATHVWNVVRGPVLFMATLGELVARVRSAVYVDVSPSGVLANFAKRLVPSSVVTSVMTPFGNDRATFESGVQTIVEARREGSFTSSAPYP